MSGRFVIAATFLLIVSCETGKKVSPCTNTPEDLLNALQVQSLYAITDTLIRGVHLRHCQLYVYKLENPELQGEHFRVRPNVSHLRENVYEFKLDGDSVHLVKP